MQKNLSFFPKVLLFSAMLGLSLFMLLLPTSCTPSCDCVTEIRDFGLEVVQTDATYFKWGTQSGVPSYRITIVNSTGASVAYSFKLSSNDAPKHGIPYDGFFKQGGGSYKVSITCLCSTNNACEMDSPKSNEITVSL